MDKLKTGYKPQRSEILQKSLLPFAALAVLLIFNIFFTHNFVKIEVKDGRLFGAIIDIFHRGAPVMLLAIGMTLVIATRGIDLSVGAVMAITGAVSALLLTTTALPVPVIVALSLLISCAAGLWNGLLVAYFKIQPIVATLILMVAGRGIAQLLTNGQIITFENKGFEYIGSGGFLRLPVTIFIVAVVFAIAMFITRRTIIGTYIEAVGNNETASTYSGINAGLIKLLVYAFCGICAGLAGIIATADIKAADATHIGLNLELDAILSVIIGGTLFTGGKFNLVGSIIGALVIRTLTSTILMRGVDIEYTLVVKAITVILVCLIQSPQIKEIFTTRKPRRRHDK